MEELPAEPEARHAVRPVADDWKLDRSEVNADLVRSAGLEPYLEERVPREELGNGEVRHGLPRRRRIDRLPRWIAPVTADGRIDPAAPRPRPAANERRVLALERAAAHESLQASMCFFSARDDEQAGRASVEPVHDARTVHGTARSAVSEERRSECPRGVAGAWVYDDAGGLVHDQEMIVRECDPQPDGLGLRLQLGGDRRRLLEGDALASDDVMALRTRHTVDEHRVRADQPFREGARADAGLAREKAVQPKPARRGGHDDLDQGRSVEAPGRRLGLRSPESIVPSRRMTPATMHASARLNAGQ
jgi:hypothetical protein